jgi:hypothetical protein
MLFAEGEPGQSVWQEFIHITTDPAHIGAELVFTLVFDVLVLTVFWGLLIKPYLDRRFHRAADEVHAEIDAEHGVVHGEPAAGQGHAKIIESKEGF